MLTKITWLSPGALGTAYAVPGVGRSHDLRAQHNAVRQLRHLDRPLLRLSHGMGDKEDGRPRGRSSSLPATKRAPQPDLAFGVGTRARAGTRGHDVPRQADIALRTSCAGSCSFARATALAPFARDTRAWRRRQRARLKRGRADTPWASARYACETSW